MLNKKQRTLCAWEEVVEQGAYGNHASLVLHLIIESGMCIHDVLAMRHVCSAWKRIVDAQHAYFERVCKFLKCKRHQCGFFALYSVRETVGVQQVFDLCASNDAEKRELFTRIIQAVIGWKVGSLYRSDPKAPDCVSPYKVGHENTLLFRYETRVPWDIGVYDPIITSAIIYDFAVNATQPLFYKKGGTGVWQELSFSDLTGAYVAFVNNVQRYK
jgi:hypothetical protein